MHDPPRDRHNGQTKREIYEGQKRLLREPLLRVVYTTRFSAVIQQYRIPHGIIKLASFNVDSSTVASWH